MFSGAPVPREHPLFNPDAGSHALPDDPREIEAVLAATQRCYAAHPYFLARYGARGLSFTNSDGGYLVTLTGTWQSHVHGQVHWLCDLLSARGMPSWLMEEHLRLLHEELRQRIRGQSARLAKLKAAGSRLREQRLTRMAQADFDAIAQAFETDAGPGIANAGGLIPAAVCDERGGREQSIPSLVRWLADPARFPPRWCAAVAEALGRARGAPRPVPHREP